MQRFELVEGKSSKFWEVSRDGSTYTVRYGRIGSNGQTLSKTAASDSKAQAEVDKLIKEKTGKGYLEVAVAAGASLAAVTAAPAARSAAPTAPASPASPAPAQAAQATAASNISEPVTDRDPTARAQPSGEFQCTPAWRRLLPAQRGHSLSERAPTAESLMLRLPPLVHGALQHSRWLLRDAGLAALYKQFPLEQLLTADSLRQADSARWQAAIQMGRMVRGDNGECALSLLMELCVVLHGIEFAIRHYFTAMAALPPSTTTYWYFADALGIDALNTALARCSDEDYQRARDWVAALPASTERERFLRGAVFNSEQAWVAEALDAADMSNFYAIESVAALVGVRLSLEQADRLIKASALRGHNNAIVLALNLAREHGAAALPLVARLYDRQVDAPMRSRLADILRAFDSGDAFAELLERIDHKEVRSAIDDFAQSWPYAAMQAATTRIARSRNKSAEAWLTRMLGAHRDALDELRADAALDSPARELIDRLSSKLVQLEEAALEALPAVLSDPPWLKPRTKLARPTLPETEPPAPRMDWPSGLREEWQQRLPATGAIDPDSNKHKARLGEALESLSVPRELWSGIISGAITDLRPHIEAIEAHRSSRPSYHRDRSLYSLAQLSPQARLLLWNALPGFDSYSWEGAPTVGSLIAHYELQALPGLLLFLNSRLEAGLLAALPVAAAEIAEFAAKGLSGKKARAHAGAWLRRHAELATTALLAQVARGSKQAVAAAEAGLRWLSANVEPDRLLAGTACYGKDGEALLRAIIAVDPLSILPQKARPLPGFYLPAGFSRPLLHDGRALPPNALAALGTMLQVSLLDEPYAGLEQVKSICQPASLDDFAWDLFQAWYQSGAVSKESWAFTAMGLIGGEQCVRRLTPMIREWPGESQHARAVTGLDVLAGIGSDLALMNLNGIAQKAKFKGLQERAKDKIQAIAEARDLSTEELADRLVPDLDLDANGTLLLDFGPRQFTVGFDEQLRPFVLDASGARLKDLPKPNKGDDAEQAKAASERWKLLKKDVKSIASNQIQRLELAMCSGRSFELAVFRQFFVEHPLMRHLTRRLLWGVQSADGSVRGFRVAEDLSFADAEDMELQLPDDARICLPHVLQLSAQEQAAFGQIFADYEILQPFLQLGREILSMSEEEIAGSTVIRFKGKRVAIGSVYGLQHRGWRHGSPQDGGWIGWFEKSLPGGLEVQIELDPGTVVGDISYEPKQTLGALCLRVANTWDDAGQRPFKQLDPIARSELLRDLDRLSVLVD